MHRSRSILVIIVVFSLLLSACSGYDSEGDMGIFAPNDDKVIDMGPVYGGTLHLAALAPDSFNPILTKDIYTKDILDIMFEGMVRVDENGKAVPSLAEKWEVAKDGLTWTFKIRNNVSWHDNMPLTAEDVEFTIRMLLNPSVDSIYKKNVEKITIFEVVDKYTIKLLTSMPYSFLPELMTFPIIPKHIFEDSATGSLKASDIPVGSGPYAFRSYNKKTLEMDANRQWWGGIPYISSIVVKICRNYNEYLNSIQIGEADVLRLKRDELSKFSNRMDVDVKRYAGRDFDFLAFNLSKQMFKDKDLRQAIAYGIDKFRLMDGLLKGKVLAAEVPLLPGSLFADPNIKLYNRDRTKVSEILRKKGWNNLQFNLTVNKENAVRVKVAEEIAQELAESGIKINVKQVTWEQEQEIIRQKSYDMILSGWRLSNIQDVSFAYSSLEAFGGNNVSGYSNPTVDELLTQIKIENDMERKKEKYYNIQAIVSEELPYIGLYFANEGIACSKRIKGQISPYYNNIYYNIAKWYIPKK